jgi:hypothetical protein
VPGRQLSFNARRAIVGLAVVLTLLCLINYYFDLGLFGSFDKQALMVSTLVLGYCVLGIGPTVEEIRNYRDRKRASTR